MSSYELLGAPGRIAYITYIHGQNALFIAKVRNVRVVLFFKSELSPAFSKY